VLARRGDYKILDGPSKSHRFVVIGFPSIADAIACHESEACRKAAAERKDGGGQVELEIIDAIGAPGDQI